jgi:hypothetical protein
MLLSPKGTVQHSQLTGPHWDRYGEFRLPANQDLWFPLRTRVENAVAAAIARQPYPTIPSAPVGAEILGEIDSRWHGEFDRRFPQFPSGAKAGLCGTDLWNYIAELRDDWWVVTTLADPHKAGRNSRLYRRLRPGDPLIPQTSQT